MIEKSFNYIYKITNTINGMIYIGVHHTSNLDDGYMGSGKRLINAIEKYGIEHFKKDILEYFDTWKEALQREKEIVNEEFVERKDTYNITTGGGSFYHLKGTVTVYDKIDKIWKAISSSEYNKNKDRYNTATSGKVNVMDENGNGLSVPKDEYRKNKNKYHTSTSGKVFCVEKDTNIRKLLTVEEYQKEKDKYYTFFSGKINVKDKNNNRYFIDKNDPRYLSGELIPVWTGLKHSEETKQKMKMSKKGQCIGEKNSQYNTCWIHNDELKQNKKIKKEELEKYISEGWIKGRLYKYNKNYIPPIPRKCAICGLDYHNNSGLCGLGYFKKTDNLIKLGFNISKIGTPDVFNEWSKLKDKLYDLYVIQHYSTPSIKKMFNISCEKVITKILNSMGIKRRSLSEANKIKRV